MCIRDSNREPLTNTNFNIEVSKDNSILLNDSFFAEDGILIKRLLERGKLSGRVDDQDESKIKNRFEEYNQKTAPLINYYKRQNG